MKISIKKTIIILFCSVILFVLIAQIVFNLFFSQSFLKSKKEKDLIKLYNTIADNYSDDTEKLNELSSDDENIHGFTVCVFSDKKILYATKSGIASVNRMFFETGSKAQEFRSRFVLSPKPMVSEKNKDNISMLTVMGLVKYNNENRYIYLSLPMVSIKNSALIFTQSSIIISVVVLAIGIIVVLFMARSLSKPITDIEVVSKKLSGLDFSYHANEKIPIAELSSLSKSINTMSHELEKSIIELITANEKLQKDVDYQKQIEVMRRQFVANVSHEMKTPLALLQLYSENLKNNVDGIDRDEYCDTIMEEVENLNDMVKSMLEISSIENGLSHINREKINLSLITENVLRKYSPMLEEFDLITDIESDIYISGDEKLISQAICNYLSNAVSHTIKGKKIIISLKSRDNRAKLSVYNDGSRIDDKDISHIWESFYKSDEARTRSDNSNAGLGLYIVKTIIDNHDGKCCARNLSDGVEFCFKIKCF